MSILGLLLGIRHLALHGVAVEQLRPARRLLIFVSVATLALNVADPLVKGDFGKAAVDSVGPLLLIGWGEVGPGLLRAIAATGTQSSASPVSGVCAGLEPGAREVGALGEEGPPEGRAANATAGSGVAEPGDAEPARKVVVPEELVARARQYNADHWAQRRRPISAETLRQELRIGADRARLLVSIIRTDQAGFVSRAKR